MENTSQYIKNILGLQLPTDPRWVNLAEMQLEEVLILNQTVLTAIHLKKQAP